MSDNSQPHSDFFAAHLVALRERLQYFLFQLPPLLRADVMRALEEPGKLCYSHNVEVEPRVSLFPTGVWPLITILIAQYILPDIDSLLINNVAISVECFVCAADLLDDVEDGEQTEILQELGISRVLNVSTALLMLAQRAIVSLSEQGVSPVLIISLLNIFEQTTLVTIAGQHLDLLAEKSAKENFNIEKCIEIVEKKSGTLMSLPFLLALLCSGADNDISRKFTELGKLLGIASQLDNDCRALYYLLHKVHGPSPLPEVKISKEDFKTDFVRGKKTLPLVLAAQAEAASQQIAEASGSDNVEISLKSLHEGLLATKGISLLYRERARECLREVEIYRPISPALRLLLRLEDRE